MVKELTDADYLKMNLSDLPLTGYEEHRARWNDAQARKGNETTGRLANPIEADDITQEMVDEASEAQRKGEESVVAEMETVVGTTDISEMTVDEARTFIASVSTGEELKALRKQEKAGRNRVGIMEALDRRESELALT